jgi:hypothetical protein
MTSRTGAVGSDRDRAFEGTGTHGRCECPAAAAVAKERRQLTRFLFLGQARTLFNAFMAGKASKSAKPARGAVRGPELLKPKPVGETHEADVAPPAVPLLRLMHSVCRTERQRIPPPAPTASAASLPRARPPTAHIGGAWRPASTAGPDSGRSRLVTRLQAADRVQRGSAPMWPAGVLSATK